MNPLVFSSRRKQDVVLRASLKRQALITKERGNEKQDLQKDKNRGKNILSLLKAFWLKW